MKFLNKLTKKLTKSASTAVKSEVKKTAVDMLPTVLGVVSMIVGILVFRGVTDDTPDIKPSVSNTSITTNNYFFRDMDDEMIKSILEDK